MIYGFAFDDPLTLFRKASIIKPNSFSMWPNKSGSLVGCIGMPQVYKAIKEPNKNVALFESPSKMAEFKGLCIDFKIDKDGNIQRKLIIFRNAIEPRPHQKIKVIKRDEIKEMLEEAASMPLCTPIYSDIFYKIEKHRRPAFKERMSQFLFGHGNIDKFKKSVADCLTTALLEKKLEKLLNFFQQPHGQAFLKSTLQLVGVPLPSILYDELAKANGLDAYEFRYFQSIRTKILSE